MRRTYHPEAEAELIEAALFYEARSRELGDRFLQEFETAITQIQRNPDLWPKVDVDLRSHTMRRFPFAIYYRVVDDELRILVVKHHTRHPDYWRQRLPE